MENFRERSRLFIGAPIAIAIGGLVRQVVLYRNERTTTLPQRGGWTPIPLNELQDQVAETIAPVIPINTPTTEEVLPGVRRVIDVQDIPQGPAQRPNLSVVGRLIDVEDIPAS